MSTDSTVLRASLEVLKAHGLTTIFGNPGSNEIPFLAGLDEDFEFILGLHEQTVVGMAEGYARNVGKPALVNLHAASGSGNAMGALTNAHYAHTPMVVLAGQQVRRTVGQETMLANADASMLPYPLVKYSHEPLSAQDVPRALSQAILESTTAPMGPVYLSVPLDDWQEPALADDDLLVQRRVSSSAEIPAAQMADLIAEVDQAENPAIILGPQHDAAATHDEDAYEAAIELVEKLNATAYVAPSPTRGPFPTTHPNYGGVLVPGIKSVRDSLAKYDLVLVLGTAVFRYHRWEPSNYLNDGVRVIHITQDPREATRAPFGESYVADIAGTVKALASEVQDRGSRRGERGSKELPAPILSEQGMTGTEIIAVLNRHVHDNVQYVNETTTLDLDYLERIAIERPNMYHFPASGGLGFGLPVAVGLSLGDASKTVVATVGDGSANYGITALYTAAKQQTRTIFVIVNNSGYGALAGFAERMGAPNVPGLELNGLDFVLIAEGYGVPARKATNKEEFEAAYVEALKAKGPTLIDARVV